MKETISKSADTDLKLVAAIRTADEREKEKAFATLYKKYYDTMVFHFRSHIKNEELVKEIVLEAFEKMNENLEKFNEDAAAFSTWLFKLTNNLFIDRIRKKKREDGLTTVTDLTLCDNEGHESGYEMVDEDSNPEEKVIAFEKNKYVCKAIDSIDNKIFATVIKLKYFDGLSYEEIGEKIEKPLGTVKAYLFRAKAALKKEIVKINASL